MEQSDFDDLIRGAREFMGQLSSTYRDITGEDLDLESAVRHYPLLAVGLAAGAGALGGWYVARRGRKQLPPPPTQPSPREYVERFLPDSLDKVRDLIPESLAEEAATQARTWMESVLEPRLKESVDSAVTNLSGSRWGAFLKETIQRFEAGPEQELDDPE